MDLPKKLSIGLLATAISKKYVEQIEACKDTWCERAKDLGVSVFFFGGYKQHPGVINLEGVKEDYNSAFDKQFLGLKWMIENSPSEFYLFGGTDNYFDIDNLLKYVDEFNHHEKLFIGGHGDVRIVCGKRLYFHSGGAGIMLSHSLLKELYDQNVLSKETHKKWCEATANAYPAACDLAISHYVDEVRDVKVVKDQRFKGCSCYGRCHNEITVCCDMRKTLGMWGKLLSCHYMEPTTIREYHDYLFPKQPPPSDDWTIVTAFFDLRKYKLSHENEQENADSIDEYISNSKFVMSLDVNLVIYCDEHLEDVFKKYRKEYGLLHKTFIKPISLEESPYYEYRDLIRENRKNIKPSADPRNTPLYFVTVSSKFHVIKDAITQDYFNTSALSKKSYYAWVDIGLAKVTGAHKDQLYRALSVKREKCSFCYIDYTPEEIMRDPNIYYSHGRCGTACGFFTGERDNMLTLCDLFKDMFTDTVTKGYGHAEEQLIPPIYHDQPSLFEFYFGDYNELLANYDDVRISPLKPLNILIPHVRGRNKKLWKSVSWKLFTSMRDGITTFTPEQANLITNEVMLSHSGKEDYQRAKEALKFYVKSYGIKT